MTKEELEKIDKIIQGQLSYEISIKDIPEEMNEEFQQIGNCLRKLLIHDIAHSLYHIVEKETNCNTAIGSICIKLFISGYNCRKTMEEDKELARMVSDSNS